MNSYVPVFQDRQANQLSILCKGRLVDLSTPRIMGILNVSPDSFYDGGKFTEERSILERAEQILTEGADFIDLGAVSTRPGAADVSEQEEMQRLLPALRALLSRFPDVLISIDTQSARVAEAAIVEGAAIINDVSGGNSDPNMFQTVGKLQVPYVLMHMQGRPKNMQDDPHYQSVSAEVLLSLANRMSLLQEAGVKDVLLDPGFGFGKSTEHNYALLNDLELMHLTGCPILAGVSRKSMINKALGISPKQALNGTSILHAWLLERRVNILRVHDVKEAREAVVLFQALKGQKRNG